MAPLTVSRNELLVEGSDSLFRQVIHDALGFSARLQEIRNRLGETIGLTGPAYSILIAIEHLGREGEIGISGVGEHLHLSGAFVTIEVNKLVKLGLVDKRVHPEDGRRVVLTPTPKARRLLEELSSMQRPVSDAMFAGFTARQFRSFADFIAALVAGTEEALALLHARSEPQTAPARAARETRPQP